MTNTNTYSLDTPVQFIKGVGPQKARLFKKLKIETFEDLLYYFPRRYEDRSHLTPISQVTIGTIETVAGTVATKGIRSSKQGKDIFTIALMDHSGVILATWFNQPYLDKIFKKGQRVIMTGKVQLFDKKQLVSPEYELLTGEDDIIHTARIVPLYSLTENLYQKYVRKIMYAILHAGVSMVTDILPLPIRECYSLPESRSALIEMHFPSSFEEQKRALYRFKFEELFLLELAVWLKKLRVQKTRRKTVYSELRETVKTFLQRLPFSLTKGQMSAIKDIVTDMEASHPMNRLLQGDVGSGKTVVAVAAAYGVCQSGNQVVFMAPTEILARQHYETIFSLLRETTVSIGLLVGDMKAKEKENLLEDIASGKAQFIIGTHALLQEKVTYNNLSFIIIDEQHRFGVLQRSKLIKKSRSVDVLVMTATPIPRTLTMTVYGDLEVSLLKEAPPDRGEVVTTHITEERLQNVYRFIAQEITKGRQAFIIYPAIDESDTLDIKAATKMYEELKNSIFKEYSIGLIHGKMSSEEKAKTLFSFREGTMSILIATTIIEVGIDIPNASIMLIENAERFGLSQLHQLRGRIGRGTEKSYCILQGIPKTEEGKMRIKALVETTDGFRIAEKDLAIRGPGEFFGTKQYGLPEFKIANIVTDAHILHVTHQVAKNLLEKNPDLSGEDYKALKAMLIKKFKGKFQLFSV
ncbi:ATP-dependent DNA helicase RecG [Chlamydiota bacterium]